MLVLQGCFGLLPVKQVAAHHDVEDSRCDLEHLQTHVLRPLRVLSQEAPSLMPGIFVKDQHNGFFVLNFDHLGR